MFWLCITEVNFHCWLHNFFQGGGQLPLRLPPTSSVKQAKPVKKPPPSKVLNPKWVYQSRERENALLTDVRSDKVWQHPPVWEFVCFALSLMYDQPGPFCGWVCWKWNHFEQLDKTGSWESGVSGLHVLIGFGGDCHSNLSDTLIVSWLL